LVLGLSLVLALVLGHGVERFHDHRPSSGGLVQIRVDVIIFGYVHSLLHMHHLRVHHRANDYNHHNGYAGNVLYEILAESFRHFNQIDAVVVIVIVHRE
jgi:hypothetical protein